MSATTWLILVIVIFSSLLILGVIFMDSSRGYIVSGYCYAVICSFLVWGLSQAGTSAEQSANVQYKTQVSSYKKLVSSFENKEGVQVQAVYKNGQKVNSISENGEELELVTNNGQVYDVFTNAKGNIIGIAFHH